ncbi:unnamed protein product, partial [Discosporangium mesarthrocarpum]
MEVDKCDERRPIGKLGQGGVVTQGADGADIGALHSRPGNAGGGIEGHKPCDGGHGDTAAKGEGRLRERAGAGTDEANWPCSSCTYINSVLERRCGVCRVGMRPPGMGRGKGSPLSPCTGEENQDPEADQG